MSENKTVVEMQAARVPTPTPQVSRRCPSGSSTPKEEAVPHFPNSHLVVKSIQGALTFENATTIAGGLHQTPRKNFIRQVISVRKGLLLISP